MEPLLEINVKLLSVYEQILRLFVVGRCFSVGPSVFTSISLVCRCKYHTKFFDAYLEQYSTAVALYCSARILRFSRLATGLDVGMNTAVRLCAIDINTILLILHCCTAVRVFFTRTAVPVVLRKIL